MATYVLPGWSVWAEIKWKNKGAVDYAPEFRIGLKKHERLPTAWNEGVWVKSPVARPGETVVARPSMEIPKAWSVGGTIISVQIELLGKEGAMWGPVGWWKTGVGIGILEVPAAGADWVEVISVAPYAGEVGPG